MSDIVKQYYETTGERYRMSSTRRDRVFSLLGQAINSYDAQTPISVLDIGIGSGEIASYCREHFSDRNISVTGIDISERLLAQHAHLYAETKAVNVDADQWTDQFKQQFHIVIASELVEHLFRPDAFFKSLPTVIAPHGYVLLSTPNMLLWSQRIKFLLGRHAWSDGGVFEWGHIHLFSWKFLCDQLEKNGFAIHSTKHVLHPNALNAWQHILPPGLFAFQFVLLAQKK